MRAAGRRGWSNIVKVGIWVLMSAVLLVAPEVSAQTTYTYVGNTFDTVLGSYTASMRVDGGFTVANQLPPNLPRGTDISAQVVSYSFSDGVQTLNDLNSYIFNFTIGTDSSCNITEWAITVRQGSDPVADITIRYTRILPESSTDMGVTDAFCATVSSGRCVSNNVMASTGTNYGFLVSTAPATPGSWSGPPCPVSPPTTYTYAGNTFDTVLGSYAASMRVDGGFTVANQLPPNLPRGTDISAQVVSYSFSDGVQTLDDLNSYIFNFTIGTDSSCNITEWAITVRQGSDPVADITIRYTRILPESSTDMGVTDAFCPTVSSGRCVSNDVDAFTGTNYGFLVSTAPATPGSWSGPPCPVSPPTTYTYAGNTFDTVLGSYTTSMRVDGGFSVSNQLPTNLPPGTDISAQVVSYSFSDGVQTLDDLNSYIFNFTVGTGPSCDITEWAITVRQGSDPVADITIRYTRILPESSTDMGVTDAFCSTVTSGRCVSNNVIASTGTNYGFLVSTAPATPGLWSGPPCAVQDGAAIPTLGIWGILVFSGALVLAAVWILAGRLGA